MKKILYLSYDGMTDPLGQSQVINYLIGLTKLGYSFDILSFEKKDKLIKSGKYIQNLLDENKINWYPQVFHSNIKIASKIYDKLLFYSVAKKIHSKNKYDLIHCRSYISAEIGLKLKKKTGVKFLFDMRSFWADEKAEGGHWNQQKLVWRLVYNFYKKKEKKFISQAVAIISLTIAAKFEIEKWPFYNPKIPIWVIPCCTDTEYFKINNPTNKANARTMLNIPQEAYVLSYLGSLGSWYLINEMVLFFKELKNKKPNAIFVIITNSDTKAITQIINDLNFKMDDFRIVNVPYSDVPSRMYASDISISFIQPVYSKMSSSPVKIGEILSMGIPIIANDIGDSGILIKSNKVGILVEDFKEESFKKIVNQIDKTKLLNPQIIRDVAIKEYSLQKGVTLYAQAYQHLFC